MNYKEMTVAELRAETKKRGLCQQKNGKKLVKSELVEQLKDNDLMWSEKNKTEHKEEEKTDNNISDGICSYKELIKKYSESVDVKKIKSVNDKDIVVFVHHVMAKNCTVYKKIRTGKAVKVNDKKEIVYVELLSGTKLDVAFEDVLYIRKDGERLPADLRKYLNFKRSNKGKELIKERLM